MPSECQGAPVTLAVGRLVAACGVPFGSRGIERQFQSDALDADWSAPGRKWARAARSTGCHCADVLATGLLAATTFRTRARAR